MIDSITELEKGLRAQQESLAKDIRAAEASLITTKEGYLKVQGALEILDILKKKIEQDDAASLAAVMD
jgi:phosphopantetheinyl transferase